ncbi:MAG: ABC transporter ATP-binding protein/permease [Firmicutes bacterium]|nr:ABC transporter ATP-binding protein/permease [Bacillota bacterium]
MKPYRLGLIITVICGVLKHGSTIGAAALSAYSVGLAMEGLFLDQAQTLIMATLFCIGLRVIMYYCEMYFSHKVAFDLLVDFRIGLFDALERISPSIFMNMRSGEMTTTLMSDVELLELFFAHTFCNVVIMIIVPFFILIYMGSFHWMLAVVVTIFLFLILGTPFLLKKQADLQGKTVRQKMAVSNAVTVEGIHGLKEILTLNFKDHYQEKNMRYMDDLSESQMAYGKRLGLEGAVIQALIGIAMLVVMGITMMLVFQGQLDFSYFPMMIILTVMIFNPVVEVSHTARNFGLVLAAADRVYDVLEAKPLVADKGAELDISRLTPSIEFNQVSFRYKEDLPLAVSGLSFKIAAGETVAIVGSSGAGKSTCAQLLVRYWDALEGEIKIGGIPIKNISLNKLHELTTAVLQDVYLFNDTISENIRLGKKDASDGEIVDAAKLARIDEFIMSMERGYESLPGESGNQLSGGQKQRIAIARAVLKNAPILILDEAVSNLDTENEYLIQEELKLNRKGKTTIMIAHRLSTILIADRIIVMDGGTVIEEGRHEELMERNGFYKRLINSQY